MARAPKQIPSRELLTETLIAGASYVGSPEHKTQRWWGGLPAAYVGPDGMATRPKKQTTTVCHLIGEADRLVATDWLREALRRQQLRYYEADQVFPKHIWYREDNGRLWFGFCINTVQGQYKGWPINEEDRRAVFG